MTVKLPDSQEDISLDTYQKYIQLDIESKDYEDDVFCLFTGIDKEDIKNISKKDIDSVLSHVAKGLTVESEFKQTFFIDGKEFGLIPNFDKIRGTRTSSGGEYSDMVMYSKNEIEGYNPNLDRLMAVLYRPITSKDSFGNYQIEEYNGTSGHVDYIKKLPLSIVNGCLGFFLTLSEQLERAILAYTVAEQQKEK